MPPQPALPFGPVDQLVTPMMTAPDGWSSNTGPPESPVHAPSPAWAPCPAGSTRRICKLPGLPVAIRAAVRTVPALLPSPRTVTPMPAMVNLAPGTIGSCGAPSTALFSPAGDLSCNNATSAVARCASIACIMNCGCVATLVTSCNCGCRSAPYSTILYSAPGCTQCATVNTSVGAISAPEQKLPREPTMVTMVRPMPSVDGAAAPMQDNIFIANRDSRSRGARQAQAGAGSRAGPAQATMLAVFGNLLANG